MKDRLYRSRKTRVLGGVAGGLAEYFNLDPILVRIIFVIIALINGFGILLYIILWIVVPEESFEKAYGIKPEPPFTGTSETKTSEQGTTDPGTSESTSTPPFEYPYQKRNGRVIFGIVLILIGLLFFANKVFPYFNFSDILPLILIIVGIVLIYNSQRNNTFEGRQ